MNIRESYDYLFKIVLIGDSGVGKTNLLSGLTRNEFLSNSKATIGVEFATKTFTMDNSIIKAQIWDTAGQEMHGGMSQIYYLNAHGAIIMYNVTSRSTFAHVQMWLSNLRQITNVGNFEIPVVVVGNMTDLADRKVKHQQVISEISNKVFKTVDMSVKTNYHIEEPFLYLTRALLNDNTIKFAGNKGVQAANISLQDGILNSENIQKARTMDLPDDDN
ncbi:GTP-binding nuclear protein GSP1/Ran [Dictyocoela roeselum]|nr:GTP-binding nuclear protein GSP1/Ran [Dictyocoela roeselum]